MTRGCANKFSLIFFPHLNGTESIKKTKSILASGLKDCLRRISHFWKEKKNVFIPILFKYKWFTNFIIRINNFKNRNSCRKRKLGRTKNWQKHPHPKWSVAKKNTKWGKICWMYDFLFYMKRLFERFRRHGKQFLIPKSSRHKKISIGSCSGVSRSKF